MWEPRITAGPPLSPILARPSCRTASIKTAVTLLYSWGNHSTQRLRNWSKDTQLVREAALRRTRHLGPQSTV